MEGRVVEFINGLQTMLLVPQVVEQLVEAPLHMSLALAPSRVSAGARGVKKDNSYKYHTMRRKTRVKAKVTPRCCRQETQQIASHLGISEATRAPKHQERYCNTTSSMFLLRFGCRRRRTAAPLQHVPWHGTPHSTSSSARRVRHQSANITSDFCVLNVQGTPATSGDTCTVGLLSLHPLPGRHGSDKIERILLTTSLRQLLDFLCSRVP